MGIVVMAAHTDWLLQTGNFVSNGMCERWQIVAIDAGTALPNRVCSPLAVVSEQKRQTDETSSVIKPREIALTVEESLIESTTIDQRPDLSNLVHS